MSVVTISPSDHSESDSIVLGHVMKDGVLYYKYSKSGMATKISSDHFEIGKEAITKYWQDIGMYYHVVKPTSMQRTIASFDANKNIQPKKANDSQGQATPTSTPRRETKNQTSSTKSKYRLLNVQDLPGNKVMYTFTDIQNGAKVTRMSNQQLDDEMKALINEFFAKLPIINTRA